MQKGGVISRRRYRENGLVSRFIACSSLVPPVTAAEGAHPLSGALMSALLGTRKIVAPGVTGLAISPQECWPRQTAPRAFEIRGCSTSRIGRFSRTEGLIRLGCVAVRAASGRLHNMCVPERWARGLAHLAYYVGGGAVRTCGPQNCLMLYVISHWAFGRADCSTKSRRRRAERSGAR